MLVFLTPFLEGGGGIYRGDGESPTVRSRLDDIGLFPRTIPRKTPRHRLILAWTPLVRLRDPLPKPHLSGGSANGHETRTPSGSQGALSLTQRIGNDMSALGRDTRMDFLKMARFAK